MADQTFRLSIPVVRVELFEDDGTWRVIPASSGNVVQVEAEAPTVEEALDVLAERLESTSRR
jgi:hypothetical protein